MDWNGLSDYFDGLADDIIDDVPEVVAETATEYFKETFTKKEFDGNPWAPAKKAKHTGSLLIESGNLVNSIKPSYIGTDKVVISAGSDKVSYAQAHNEGFTGMALIPAHTRRTKKGGIANVREYNRRMNLPQRQFMGEANELAAVMVERIEDAIAKKI